MATVQGTESFRALRVSLNGEARGGEPSTTVALETFSLDDLPAGEVIVRVAWSSLNYKDALSLSGNRGVTRSYPHTPGIDAAGEVVAVGEGGEDAHAVGDRVIVQGDAFGQSVWGGWSEYVRVPSHWVTPLPDGLSAREAMAYGTAGLTAAIAADRIQHSGVGGEVAVTGASGGVGSIGVGMLARLGYSVVASTGRGDDTDTRSYMEAIGVSEIVTRDAFTGDADRPLMRGRFGGALDTTGGAILAGLLRHMAPGGVCTACGLTAGAELATTVYPFILRGVTLSGIDSTSLSVAERTRVWQRIASDLRVQEVERRVAVVELKDVEQAARALLNDSHSGRTVVRIAAE